MWTPLWRSATRPSSGHASTSRLSNSWGHAALKGKAIRFVPSDRMAPRSSAALVSIAIRRESSRLTNHLYYQSLSGASAGARPSERGSHPEARYPPLEWELLQVTQPSLHRARCERSQKLGERSLRTDENVTQSNQDNGL